jgi:glycosyltransferase involved in cell wall biosynthesis
MSEQQPTPLVSVIIPIKDEAENILALAREIEAAFANVAYTWEVMWVDDGSNDHSLDVIKSLSSPHRFISLASNCGQSAALMAGAREVCSEWLATLDGDGQNDPADLPRQLAWGIQAGADMVNGIRTRRQDNRVRKVCSRIANGFRNRLTQESVQDVGCSTRVVRRAAVLELPFFHGMHRFLPTLVRMRGYRHIEEIPVNHRPRGAGSSKYGINNRLWSGMRDVFAVRWLMSRKRTWQIRERGGVTEAPHA